MLKFWNFFNIIFFLFGIFFISIIFSNKAISFTGSDGEGGWNINNISECNVSSNGVITITSSTSCSFQPNEQKLTIYQLDFCTAAPTAPTTSSSMIKNGCSTFFKNDNGSEVEVKYQEATAIGSSIDYLKVPFETFSHVVISFDPVFKFKTSITFASANVNHHGGSAESTCVTKKPSGEGFFFSYGADANFARGTVQCGDNLTPVEFSHFVNSMSQVSTGTGFDCKQSVNFIGSSGTISTHVINSSGNLINGEGCVPGNESGIDRILGVLPITLKVNRNTVGFRIKWINKKGVMLNMDPTDSTSPFTINSIDIAPFDIFIEAVQKRSRRRGAWN